MANRTLENARTNPRTTIGGVLAAVIVILTQSMYFFDGNDATTVDFNVIVLALFALWGGANARDAEKTSLESNAPQSLAANQ